ncbi:hypothetical protein [Roseovarius aestuariivivens]|uniref:hypothetical protein n=1 Tax=Roseovarius aestuariivivens TaxID=1888910 RepID=UPI0010817D55|nr:hypothetical protein [Roseovarius aestuariivivens]
MSATAGSADSPDPVQRNNSSAVWFENWIGLDNANLRVASPDGEIRDVFSAQGTPVYELSGASSDGVYRYELRAQTDELIKNRNYPPNSPQKEDQQSIRKSFYRSGIFVVQRGVILQPNGLNEPEELKE